MPAYRLLENGSIESRAATAEAALGGIFHSATFHRLHAAGRGAFFEWREGERTVATVHYTEAAEGLWRSPLRGTFGGYAWVPELPLADLAAFHDAAEERLRERGARRIEILPAPMAHDPAAFSNQVYLLRSRGYRVSQCDLNQSLEIDPRTLAQRMSYGNRKRLAKCERENLACGLLGHEALPEVYDTIAANRAAKGHEMSMTLAQVQAMAAAFPGHLLLFGCRDAAAPMVAAAVCLRLDAATLYVFYWGDRPGHAALSPVVMVADAIHAHAAANGYSRIDVGTSTLDLEPQHGLLQFKRGLGFTESLKLRLEKNL